MVQHVHGATHRTGNTLDLIVTSSQCQLGNIDVEPPGRFSNHSLVVCQLPCATQPASFAERLVCGWRRVNRSELKWAIENSELCLPRTDDVDSDGDVDHLFACYNTVLWDIADRVAPQHSLRRCAGRLAPWFDADCHAERRDCRRLERQYRRPRSPVDPVRGSVQLADGSSSTARRRRITGSIVSNCAVDRPRKSGVQ